MRELSATELLGELNDIEAKYAPRKLFVEGHIELLHSGPRVAMVGSRDASEASLNRAGKLAHALVERGAIVVSGLARGIDTASHRAAIDAGGATIAVLGTPLNAYSIKANKPLQDLIMRDHLAISQFEPGSIVRPHNFPIRNRTMALVCHASIIMEAGEGSGTLSQGWEALRLGRPLFLSQEIMANASLQWPKEMLNYGARVLTDIEEVLEVIPQPNFDLRPEHVSL